MTKICDRDCFNCIYDDCKVDSISSAERKAIRERDDAYGRAIESECIIKRRPGRAKHRGRRGAW